VRELGYTATARNYNVTPESMRKRVLRGWAK